MRIKLSPAWIVALGLALGNASLLGQQSAPHLSTDRGPAGFTPLAIEQQPQGREPFATSSPAAIRLAGAELPLSSSSPHLPLPLAPRSEGGRSTGVGPIRPLAPTVGSTVGTVAGSLGIVLSLLLFMVWCSRRFAPPGTSMLPKEAVELLGRTTLAGRQQAQLVRVGNRILLVAISPAGAETLTEISEPTEVEHLLALCRREQPGSSSAAFRQVLSQISQEPAVGGFAGASTASRRGGR